MKAILKPQVFEKKADRELGPDQSQWESKVLKELVVNHPFLADRLNHIKLNEIDSDNDRYVGSISIIMRPGTTIEIPVVINEGILSPLDMFAYEKKLYPLSQDVVNNVVVEKLNIGELDGRMDDGSSFMEHAVENNTEPSDYLKLSKILDSVGIETLKRQIKEFGKYEKVAMADYYSLYCDKLELKERQEKEAMDKKAKETESAEWVGYAYKTDIPYTFDVVMYKRAMETNGEMIRVERMNAEQMENSNIRIYDEGHVNFKVAGASNTFPTEGWGSSVDNHELDGKVVWISTDKGLIKAKIVDATDPMGKSLGEKVFYGTLDTGSWDVVWGMVDKTPHVQKSIVDQHFYVNPDRVKLSDLENVVGKYMVIGKDEYNSDKDGNREYSTQQKHIGPFLVDKIMRYNRVGEFEGAIALDVRDVNSVKYRLLIVQDVAKPAEIDQGSDKFREMYNKLSCDRDIILMPGSYVYKVLSDKIKVVSQETYKLSKQAALRNRADKKITVYNNRSYYDVIIENDDHLKKLSFLDDNEFDAVCREEIGKYANELEIPILSKREYYVWED